MNRPDGALPCYDAARTNMTFTAMRKQMKIKRASRKRVPRAAAVYIQV